MSHTSAAVLDREIAMVVAGVAVAAVINRAAIVAEVVAVDLVVVDIAEAAAAAAAVEALLEVLSVDLHLVLTIKCLTMIEILITKKKLINKKKERKRVEFI